MSLRMDTEKAEKRIEEFIKQTEGLLELSYDEGKEEKKEMKRKIGTFVETAFSDGEKKKNKLYSPIAVLSITERSPREKQRDYENGLKRILRNLKAWKDQVELEKSSEEERGKIDKLQEQIEKEELESERRAKVVDQKYHGALIEFLDIQRDRIKEMEETSKEITEIKKEIEDIKELLEKTLEEKREEGKDE